MVKETKLSSNIKKALLAVKNMNDQQRINMIKNIKSELIDLQ